MLQIPLSFEEPAASRTIGGESDLFFATIILSLLGVFLVVIIGLFVARFFLRRQTHGRHGGFAVSILQISIPKFRREEDASREANIDQVRQAIAVTDSFFSTIGGLKAQKGFRPWLEGRTDEVAFEIVARKGLIYFYIAVPAHLRAHVEQQLSSAYPDAHIEEIEDYNIFTPAATVLGSYLVFKRQSGFPIKTYLKLDTDPLNAITNALSKLGPDDGVVIQYLVRSARKEWRSGGLGLARRMQQGMSLEEVLSGSKKKKGAGWLSMAMGTSGKPPEQPQQYKLSPLEEECVKGLEQKASKAGLDVNIRLIVSSERPVAAQTLMSNLLSAFAQYSMYQFGNAFDKAVPHSKQTIVRRSIYRTFDEFYKIVLNTEEMASLWHLPLPTTETPSIHWLGARRAAAPVNVPGPGEGIFLGYNTYRGQKTPIHIKQADRQRHMYLIGKSGSGKSQFLAGMAIQDIQNGEGVCVIDPHGDLVEQILGNIPRERIDDVIVFSPSDTDRPFGLNMLEVKNENLRDFAVQEMISIFYKLFPPEMIGPMFEHQMRNVMLTLMSDPENPGTLAEIPRIFSDQEFADSWVRKVKDPVVRAFWEKEMAKTSDFHKSEMLGYLISKVGRFVENEMMRNIIGQSHSSFDFREVMDKQKILLVNLSKGKTGEVNASLLGLIVVSKLQMAAMGRADMPEDERKDFFLYIDEFQNFVTNSIATILSEARKYRLELIMAHQYMSQLVDSGGKAEVRDAVLGNVGTMMTSRIGPEDTEVLEKVYAPTFSGYDLINSDMFTWYVKMIIDNSQAKPFTMKTVQPPKGDRELADAVFQLSRLKYGRDKALVEADILERSQLGSPAPLPPVERTL
ncbi:type IV secretory system conjugative DNA transfer family protein [Candidatus Uhrbacteria bacterium]|nr:type IV secretory system conjugative DNA transfer family protein [Candidatus Uhrbacteria bacterium]